MLEKEDKPMSTKLDPLILTTFLLAPLSMLAPTRSFATLLSAIVATVLLPIATVAAPAPTADRLETGSPLQGHVPHHQNGAGDDCPSF